MTDVGCRMSEEITEGGCRRIALRSIGIRHLSSDICHPSSDTRHPLNELVDFPLRDCIDRHGRAPYPCRANDPLADKKLLVHVIEEVAALHGEAVDRHDRAVEERARAVLIALLVEAPNADE